ncbi:MAG: YdcF family protein [Clostridia bacterium]|nr:YdcF family protein [Clostridia bacterium]
MLRLILGAAALGMLLWIGLVIFVTVKEKTVPEADPRETQAIIVLGAQVRQDGRLSVQLQWRLDKALELYGQCPQPVVVCGAQGANEPVSEASAMHDYLLGKGVPDSDLVIEDTSFNTRQNLMNARRLLGEDITRVLIVTSDYHVPRALALAKDAGFDACGVGSPIKLVYWPKNHFREALAWVKYWLQSCGVLRG